MLRRGKCLGRGDYAENSRYIGDGARALRGKEGIVFRSGPGSPYTPGINSRIDRVLVGDHLIGDWREAGLLFPSVATGIIRTIKQGMIARKLGSMAKSDMREFDNRLRSILELG